MAAKAFWRGISSLIPPPRTDTGSAADVPQIAKEVDVKDKIVLITGANSGVGFETAVHFARLGSIVVMCCRNLDKAVEARQRIMERANVNDLRKLRIVELELADLEDVESFPTRYEFEMGDELKHRPIDIAILNAGIMAPHEREVSKQGIESQLAVNVLGHFKLVERIIDRIHKAPHGRVVFIASQIHLWSLGHIDFDDLNREKSYWKWIVYAQSKLGVLLVAHRLNRLLVQRGIDNVLVVAAHPGYAATKIHTHAVVGAYNNYFSQSPDRCAKSYVMAAVDPNAERDGYCGPKYFLYGDPAWHSPKLPAADDVEMQDRFWHACEQMSNTKLEEKVMSLK